jgi:hypothetical protein
MLCSVDPAICFSGEALLFTVLKDSSELGRCCTGHIYHIFGPKEVVKQEHISLPSIPGPQIRLAAVKARVLAKNIGHDVPKKYACHSQKLIPFEALLRSSLGPQFNILLQGPQIQA